MTELLQEHHLPVEKLSEKIRSLVREDPESSQALILYALVNTLAYPRGGCLFRLDKFKDLGNEHRKLACALIEAMATGDMATATFGALKQALDELVAG